MVKLKRENSIDLLKYLIGLAYKSSRLRSDHDNNREWRQSRDLLDRVDIWSEAADFDGKTKLDSVSAGISCDNSVSERASDDLNEH